MFCHSCGEKLMDDASFCIKCGTKIVDGVDRYFVEPIHSNDESSHSIDDLSSRTKAEADNKNEENHITNAEKNKSKIIIKCGNCEYIGSGEPARNIISLILAWICIIFCWPITVIYFITTHKWRCPKCKSTFLGVKNNNGVFVSQGKGGNIFIIIIVILIVVAFIGILSSLAVVSLSGARQKASDALVKSDMGRLAVEAEIYNTEKGTYSGFCNDAKALDILKSASQSGSQDEDENSYICNDSEKNWAASSIMKSGGYWCVDNSTLESSKINIQLSTQTSCL